MGAERIPINRAPVLTLWAAVVAEKLGYERDSALSLGKAVAGLNAQSKGRMLGIYGPPRAKNDEAAKGGRGEELWVDLCGRRVPARRTEAGLRAVTGAEPVDPEPVERYLQKSFGEHIESVRDAMEGLATRTGAQALAREAYALYERFRPAVPRGRAGWGARGELDLDLLRSLGRSG